MIEARTRLLTLAAGALAFAAPLAAQSSPPSPSAETRIKKIEAEVRALQRKVFPDGPSRYFEAEIAPATTATAPPTPAPSSGPVTELLTRLDTVEGALARATAQNEENANRMSKLEARLAALETGASVPAVSTPSPPVEAAQPTAALTAGTPPRSITGSVSSNSAAMAATAKPSADRVAAVAAVEKPVSTDKGEDDYLYGFRLWEAKFYPEAQQQLKATVDKYPKHKRLSYTRNLLGRAYLDDGKPGTAAQVFLQNYQADKAGDRAADSLLYLAVAMTRLKETQRACVALQEFGDVYAAEAAGRLASQYASAKSAVKCN
jgi:TolA-binding protein